MLCLDRYLPGRLGALLFRAGVTDGCVVALDEHTKR